MENSEQNQEEKTAEKSTEQQPSIDELMELLEAERSSKSRILDESKAWKSKYQGLKTELEHKEVEQASSNEDYRSLWEKASREKESLLHELDSERSNRYKDNLKFEIAKHARDANDLEDVIYNVTKRKLVAFNSETGKWEGTEDAVKILRSEKSYLFDKAKAGYVDGRPGSVVPKPKSINERLKEDSDAVWGEVLKGMGSI